MLEAYVGGRTSGFLFHNKKGNFLSQANLLRRGLHPPLIKLGQPKAGVHAFRRFRTTSLRKNRAPDDLIRYWLGPGDDQFDDANPAPRCDVATREELAESVRDGS